MRITELHRRGRLKRTIAPTGWGLWHAARPVLAYVLAVDAAAVVLVVLTVGVRPVGTSDLGRFAVLALGSAIHTEVSRGIERIREVAAEGAPYINLKGIWTFAGVLLLPPPLTATLVAIAYAHSWFRLRRITVYRWVFSAATIIVACAAAGLILAVTSPVGYPALPPGPIGLACLVAAAIVYSFVNIALLAGAILLSAPNAPGGNALGKRDDQIIAAGALGLGVAVAGLLVHEPWTVAVLLVTILGLHRALLVNQFQTAARTDVKTGLANAVFWHSIAGKELLRAQRTGDHLGVLMIDLDHFKRINDTDGHLAGDQVLKAVATELKNEVREYDLVARFGGEEFVVLLPGADLDETRHLAERIRHRIAGLAVTVNGENGRTTITTITCSIGAAVYPDCATNLDALLMAADTATYAAKNGGRNQTCLAPTQPHD